MSDELSLARMAARNQAARELAEIRFASDDEIDAEVNFVDGGAWVAARVFVDHDSIETKIAAQVNRDA